MTAQSAFQLPYQPLVVQRCSVCGQKKWSKHAETCPGPRQVIAPPREPDPGSECACNTGGMHEPDCVQVTG